MGLKLPRPLGAVFVVSTVAVVFSACQQPTQITLEITTDLECSSKPETAIIVGTTTAEGETPGTVTENCTNGRIGAIVLLPKDDKDEKIFVRVVTGVGDGYSTDDCLQNKELWDDKIAGKGCIIARRSLNFIPRTPLFLPVKMRADCLGEPCSLDRTCIAKDTCVDAEIKDPDACSDPDGCLLPEEQAQSGSTSSSSSGGSGGMAGTGGTGGTGGMMGSGGSGGMAGTGGMGGMMGSSSSSSSSSSGMGGMGGMMGSSSSSSSSSGMGGMGGMMGSSSSSSSSSSGMGGMGGDMGSSSSSSSSSSGMGGMGGMGGDMGSSSSSSSGMGGAGGMGGMMGSSSSSSGSSGMGGSGGGMLPPKVDGGVSLDGGPNMEDAGPGPQGSSSGSPDALVNDELWISPGYLVVEDTSMRTRRKIAPVRQFLRLPFKLQRRNVKP